MCGPQSHKESDTTQCLNNSNNTKKTSICTRKPKYFCDLVYCDSDLFLWSKTESTVSSILLSPILFSMIDTESTLSVGMPVFFSLFFFSLCLSI